MHDRYYQDRYYQGQQTTEKKHSKTCTQNERQSRTSSFIKKEGEPFELRVPGDIHHF